MKEKLKKRLDKFSTNRIYRIYTLLIKVRDRLDSSLSKKDEALLDKKMKELNKIYRRSKIFYTVRLISTILIYVSVVSLVFGDLLFFGWFADILVVAAGILGTSILAIIIVICQKIISIYVSEAHLVADYIIALDVKYSR